eukprot:2842741-Alexandrium_andersonii.AAC.1
MGAQCRLDAAKLLFPQAGSHCNRSPSSDTLICDRLNFRTALTVGQRLRPTNQGLPDIARRKQRTFKRAHQ